MFFRVVSHVVVDVRVGLELDDKRVTRHPLDVEHAAAMWAEKRAHVAVDVRDKCPEQRHRKEEGAEQSSVGCLRSSAREGQGRTSYTIHIIRVRHKLCCTCVV